jgi:hypothetical protein
MLAAATAGSFLIDALSEPAPPEASNDEGRPEAPLDTPAPTGEEVAT